MNKIRKVLLTVVLGLGLSLGAVSADAYSVQQKQLPNYGTQYNIKARVIVAHESGNDNNRGYNALDNEVAYMTRVWNQSGGLTVNAHYFVGKGGQVIQLLPENRQAFHAGSWANSNGIGVELARTTDINQFKKDYASYVNLIRDIAKRQGIPTTLDTGSYSGIKSHLWVSNNIWGDHADPYGYLHRMGTSKAQFAKDLANGVGNPSQVKPNKPTVPTNPPKPSQTTMKRGDRVTVVKAVNYDNGKSFYANGIYDVIEVKGQRVVIGKGNVVTSAVHFNNLRRAGTVTPKPTPQPSKPKPQPTKPVSGWYAENAVFTPNTAIKVRYGLGTHTTLSGVLQQGQSIRYNAVTQQGGYVWIRYDSYSGVRYMPVRVIGQNAWGTFSK